MEMTNLTMVQVGYNKLVFQDRQRALEFYDLLCFATPVQRNFDAQPVRSAWTDEKIVPEYTRTDLDIGMQQVREKSVFLRSTIEQIRDQETSAAEEKVEADKAVFDAIGQAGFDDNGDPL
jgi:hypothetical protein